MNILHILNSYPLKGDLPYSYIKSFQKICPVNDLVYPVEFNINQFTLKGRILNRIINSLNIRKVSLFLKLKNIDFNKYDVVFVYKGTYLKPEYIDFIRNRNKNLKIVCYNPDNPYNLTSNIIKSINKYDIYFIWSKKLKEEIENREHILTYYIPFAADLDLHNKMFFQHISKKYGISFIGNWDEERERWLLHIEDKKNLNLFGNNWHYKLKSKELLRQVRKGVVGEKFVKVTQESMINLNILRVQNKNSNNMRTFEIPASGGFCLHEYSKEVETFFKEGKEVEFFRNSEELNDKINFYLAHPDLTDRIALNGYKRIISSNYTYDKRAEEIFRIINED